MGTYDIVTVPCPECGAPEYCQSKGGACEMRGFTLSDAPLDVLSNVNRHAPFTCRICGHVWSVDEPMLAAVRGPVPTEPCCASLRAALAASEARAEEIGRERDALLSSYNEEVAEFNAGYEAALAGASEYDEPEGMKHDAWPSGYCAGIYLSIRDRLKSAESKAAAAEALLREARDGLTAWAEEAKVPRDAMCPMGVEGTWGLVARIDSHLSGAAGGGGKG